jgi:hypothetical protein
MGKVSRDGFMKAAARAAANLPRERVELPELELDGDVYVRAMTGRERDDFEESMRIKKGRNKGDTDLHNFRARLAVRCLVDEDGSRILEYDDAMMLGELPVSVLDRIMAVTNRLSGTTQEETEALGNDSASVGASGGPSSNSHMSSTNPTSMVS